MLEFLKRKKSVPFQEGHIFPIIKIEIMGRTVLMLVDSGSDRCYIDKKFFESLEYKGAIEASMSVIGATGETASFGQIDTEVIINGTDYALPMVIFSLEDKFISFGKTPAERPVGILGANFLHVYRMVLDFNKRKLYL